MRTSKAITFLDTFHGPLRYRAQSQVCEHMEFEGFGISSTCISPLPKFIKAIHNFPQSKNIYIWSWFSLVSQVSNYNQLFAAMAPFRKFYSLHHPFEWDDALESPFALGKSEKAINDGIKIFDSALSPACPKAYVQSCNQRSGSKRETTECCYNNAIIRRIFGFRRWESIHQFVM